MAFSFARWRSLASHFFGAGPLVLGIVLTSASARGAGPEPSGPPTAQHPLVAPGPDTEAVIRFLQRIVDGQEAADKPLAKRRVRGRFSFSLKNVPKGTPSKNVPAQTPVFEPDWHPFSEVWRNGKGRFEVEDSQRVKGRKEKYKAYRITDGKAFYVLNASGLKGVAPVLYVSPSKNIELAWFQNTHSMTNGLEVSDGQNSAPVPVVCRRHIDRLRSGEVFGKTLHLHCYEAAGQMVVELVEDSKDPRHANSHITFSVDPRQGYHLVKEERQLGAPGTGLSYRERHEVEYAEVAPGVYFLKKSRNLFSNFGTVALDDGGAGWGFYQVEIASVERGDFKFDQTLFEPTSLPLPDGTIIVDRRTQPERMFAYHGPTLEKALASAKTAEKKHEAGPKREPIYNPKADSTAEIAAALDAARRDHKRVLLEFGANWCGWCYKLYDVFKKNAEIAPIVRNEYQLVLVDIDTQAKVFDRYVPKSERKGVPFLTVLDSDGKVLVNQETGALEDGPKHDPKKVKTFLTKWAVPAADAEKVLADGLSQARRESKRVLLHIGAPWCGWCHVLDRFLYENRNLFAADFIDVKIDQQRMTHAERLTQRLRPAKSGGIPWIAILDADGNALATSDGPKGNIGFPAEPEEIHFFMDMLRKNVRSTSATQLAAIERSLQNERQRRLAARPTWAKSPQELQRELEARQTNPKTSRLLRKVLAAWRARQNDVRSVRFEWKYTVFSPAEEEQRLAERLPTKQVLKVAPKELHPQRLTREIKLIFDDHSTRYEERGPIRVGGSNDSYDREKLAVFDGQKRIQLVPNSFGFREGPKFRFPQAVIGDTNAELNLSDLQPLFFTFRMLDPSFQRMIDPAKLIEESGSPRAGHSPTKPLLLREGNWILNVDPDRDFIISRYSQYAEGRGSLVFETTIEYEKDAHGIWVPKSWRSLWFTEDGELRRDERSTVVRFEINPTLTPSTFRLDIPIDALVIETGQGRNQFSIQLDNGRRFPFEATTSYRDALQAAKASVEREKAAAHDAPKAGR
jgi:thiol-disulfide isomerase/thioredoxin